VAVSDITSLQQARDAQHRVEVLAAHNEELQQEIARRQVVEEDLRQSELRQCRLLTQSGRMQEELRQLAHDLLHAQEAERQRISRELHDEVIQNLVGITVGLEALARKARLNPERLRHDITGTQQLVESCVNTVHRFALELRPPALDDLGLPTTLRSLIREFRERTGIRVRFTSCAGVEELGCDQRTVLYRIAQSALANIAQHAHAGRVAVTLRPCAGGLRLEIRDDGCSFDVEQVINARTNRRLGLLGMRERAEMIGGHLEIQSAPGRGTTVRATIPAPGTSWKGDT
jgi:signal transduction histidine kinase